MTSITQRLPDDVESLKAQLVELERTLAARDADLAKRDADLAERDARITKLEHLVVLLQKAHFGPRSEQRRGAEAPGQGLFALPELLDAAQREAERTGQEGTVEVVVPTHTRRRGRRREFPEDLPRARTTYELPEEQRICCGRPMQPIGHEVSQQLERIETMLVHEVARTKYACTCCSEGVRTAPGPSRPIDRGLLGTGFLAHVIVERFARHMPYHRLEKKYASEGLSLSRSVLCRSTLRCAELLAPIVEQMKREVLASPIVQTDDTPVTIQASKGGGRKRGFAWVYKDMQGRHVFDFTESRSRDGPIAFLGDYQGFLQADAFPGYDVFFTQGGATEVACWAHARRRFVEAEATEPRLAKQALAEIRALYALEAQAKRQSLDADAIRELRQSQARPILERLADRMLAWQLAVLEKSPMGTAIRYAQAQWAALTRYTEDGRLAIDNNLAENALRGIAVGRKNWLFVGHEEAGQRGAVLMSLVRTAEAIGVEPRTYLADVLTRISVCSDVARLTPHGWKQHFAAEIAERRHRLLAALASTGA